MPRRKKKLPGLNRGPDGYWLIDKMIKGYGRFNKTTGTKDYAEAERRALKWIHEKEQAVIFGKRTRITFNQAAALYIKKEGEKPQDQQKKSMSQDISDLRKVMPHIGGLFLDQIYQETIDPYIKAEKEKGRKASTINRSLRVVSHVLRLAASSWRDEHHKPYLDSPPLIQQLPETDKSTTPPIEYSEEQSLLKELNEHYQDFWTFATHTGLREHNQTGLKWEWEYQLTTLDTTAFLIPGKVPTQKQGKTVLVKNTKNGKDFLLVLNTAAREIIEKYRGRDEVYVFPSPKGGKYYRFNNKHFRNARERAGLKGIIRWHSARATFATRLRAVRVSEEDRRQLMGHSTKSITTQYSWADIRHLIECVEKLCDTTDTREEERMELSALFRVKKQNKNA